MKVQLGHIAQAVNARPTETLPSDTLNNPNGPSKEIDNVVTFRSGKQLLKVVNPKDSVEEIETQEIEESEELEKKAGEAETDQRKGQPSNLEKSLYFVREIIKVH